MGCLNILLSYISYYDVEFYDDVAETACGKAYRDKAWSIARLLLMSNAIVCLFALVFIKQLLILLSLIRDVAIYFGQASTVNTTVQFAFLWIRAVCNLFNKFCVSVHRSLVSICVFVCHMLAILCWCNFHFCRLIVMLSSILVLKLLKLWNINNTLTILHDTTLHGRDWALQFIFSLKSSI